MAKQKELFGPQDNIPKVSTILKKVITKEQLLEAKKIYASGDYKTSAAILRELNEKLEIKLSRLTNGKT